MLDNGLILQRVSAERLSLFNESVSDSSSCTVLRPAGSTHTLGFCLLSWFHLCSRVLGASDLARGAVAAFPSFAPDSQGDRRWVTSSIPATVVKWR